MDFILTFDCIATRYVPVYVNDGIMMAVIVGHME